MHAAQQGLQWVLKHRDILYVQHMRLIKDSAVRWRTSCNLQAMTFTRRWQTIKIRELAVNDHTILCANVKQGSFGR